jgi:hypothetical protein
MLDSQNMGSGENDLRIDPRTLPWFTCSEGVQVFEPSFLFKRISPIISPTGKEELYPAEIIVCKNCNKVPKAIWNKYPDFPDELKATCD